MDSVSTWRRRRLLTFHGSLFYFAARYRLEVVGVVQAQPGSEPTAQHMAALLELLRGSDPPALFVEPQYMGRGVGGELINDAVAIARGQGVRRLEVTANPRAVGFYEKVGFTSGAVVRMRFGPALRMHLCVPG